MTCKQLSIFIENRKGRLSEVLDVLKNNDVNILSMSLADTAEYGLLRLIVNNPELGKQKLLEKGFSTMLADVIVLKIPHVAGSLQEFLNLLEKENVNIDYLYGLSTNTDNAYIVLKTSHSKEVERVLVNNGYETLTTDEICSL